MLGGGVLFFPIEAPWLESVLGGEKLHCCLQHPDSSKPQLPALFKLPAEGQLIPHHACVKFLGSVSVGKKESVRTDRV